jgi:hypothetical protein
MPSTPKMSRRGIPDWCHLCGERTPHTVDIDYKDNAEHPKSNPSSKYIRICVYCSDRIGAVSRGEK